MKYNISTGWWKGRKGYSKPVISVCRWCPSHQGEWARELAPPAKGFAGHNMTPEEFGQAYFDQVLSKLDPEQVAKKLHGKIAACYEPPGTLCHRRIVAEWLESHLEIEIPEEGYDRDIIPDFLDAPSPDVTVEESPWAARCQKRGCKGQKSFLPWAIQKSLACPKCQGHLDPLGQKHRK